MCTTEDCFMRDSLFKQKMRVRNIEMYKMHTDQLNYNYLKLHKIYANMFKVVFPNNFFI